MPEENTPSGTGFGIEDPALAARLEAAFGDDPAEEGPASPEDGATEAQDTAQPAGESADGITPDTASSQVDTDEAATPGDTDTAQETQDEEPPAPGFVFGGRQFASQDEAERSYGEMQRYVTRTRQEMQTLSAQIAERQQMQEEALAALLNQQSQSRAQADPEFAAQQELLRQLQPLVQQQVAPMQQALAAQMQDLEMQKQYIKIDSALEQFWTRHPEVREGTQENYEMAEAVRTLHDAWAAQGEVLDMSDQETLELAYEVYKDPYLHTVLSANPQLADSDRGLDYARYQAKQLRSSSGPANPTGTPSQRQVRKVVGQAADVEVPGGRSPAPTQPRDEWEEVLVLEAEDQKTPNPFLGGRR